MEHKLQPLLDDYEWSDLWTVLNEEQPQSPTKVLRELSEIIFEKSHKAALRYCAYNLTVKYLDLYCRLLPFTVRATVHGKNGQVVIPRLGEVYPWNGTGVLLDQTIGPSSIDSRPLYKNIKRSPQHTILCLRL